MKKLKKNKGITLIALIVTIIVLLILAGVSIAMLTSENGIIKQTVKAKEEIEISSEKEAIELMMVNKEMDKNNEKYNIGEELKDRTLANGDNWKIVSVNSSNKIYGTGYYFIEEGVDLDNYGKTKHNWIINYDIGEVIELSKGDFTKLKYGDNLAVTDNLILNVDPINMSDENSWGEGVTVYGIEEGDGYGWNKTEFKLDGVDDYIEVYPEENINLENGITFEFYAKKDDKGEISMLSKTLKGNTNSEVFTNNFRIYFSGGDFLCCMSKLDSGSNWSQREGMRHWIQKDRVGDFNSENGCYLTMTVDLQNNEISLYSDGEFIDSTICNHDWMTSGSLTDNNIPFTIGFRVGGNSYTEYYNKVNIYACRLYNKVLTSDEIKDNYITTSTYHNMLVNGEK